MGSYFSEMIGDLSFSLDELKHESEESCPDRHFIMQLIDRLKIGLDELKDRSRNITSIIENAPLAIAIIERNGTFSSINPKFVDLFGYGPEEIPCGRDWFRKAFPDPDY
jgi:PAS domain-containing protein